MLNLQKDCGASCAPGHDAITVIFSRAGAANPGDGLEAMLTTRLPLENP